MKEQEAEATRLASRKGEGQLAPILNTESLIPRQWNLEGLSIQLTFFKKKKSHYSVLPGSRKSQRDPP